MEQKIRQQEMRGVILRRFQDLNSLYNKHVTPEDAEKTSFIYHKILAIQFAIALFSLISIFICLTMTFTAHQFISASRAKYLLMVFTALTILAIHLETRCRIVWNQEKKSTDISDSTEYSWSVIESMFVIPMPNLFVTGETKLFNYSNENYESVSIDSLLTVYVLLRTIYIIKFLIHSQIYYGSRPDRLSRIYAVKFATVNSVRYLINQRPFYAIFFLYCINFFEFSLALLIIEGPINANYNTYLSCIYNAVISMSTVGYGDSISVTFLGRFIEILIIVMGICLTSLVLIFIIKNLNFTSFEEDSHYLMKRLDFKQQMKKALVRRIQEQWKTSHVRCTGEQKKKKIEQLKSFRLQNRQMLCKSLNQPTNIKRLMNKNFAQLSYQLDLCKLKQQLLIDQIGSTDARNSFNFKNYAFFDNQIINKQQTFME